MKTFLKIIIALFFVIAVAAGIAALFDVELPKFDIKNPFSTETETDLNKITLKCLVMDRLNRGKNWREINN